MAPTAIVYVALGELLVSALFQRVNFGPSDTRLVWFSLSAYSLGLAGHDRSRDCSRTPSTRSTTPGHPARLALVRVVVGTIVALSLMFWFDEFVLVGTTVHPEGSVADTAGLLHLGVIGIAIGSSVAAWAEFLLLRMALAWRIGRVSVAGGRLTSTLAVGLAAAAAGRAVAFVIGDPPALVAVVPVFGVAGAVYLTGTAALGMDIRKELAGR